MFIPSQKKENASEADKVWFELGKVLYLKLCTFMQLIGREEETRPEACLLFSPLCVPFWLVPEKEKGGLSALRVGAMSYRKVY